MLKSSFCHIKEALTVILVNTSLVTAVGEINIEMVLRILVYAATLVYTLIKIYKAVFSSKKKLPKKND